VGGLLGGSHARVSVMEVEKFLEHERTGLTADTT